MFTRVGLEIAADVVRMVVERGSTRTRLEERRDAGESLSQLLDRMLSQVANPWFARCVAAIGPVSVRVKRVTGLPDGRQGDLAVALQLNADRFFLAWKTSPRTVLAPHPEGGWLGASFDSSIVDEVAAACRRRGVHLVGCAPAVIANVEVAARGSANIPLLLRARGRWRSRRLNRLGVAAAIVLCALGALIVPTLVARGRETSTRIALTSLRLETARAARALRLAQTTTRQLAEIRRFDRARRSIVELLGGLAQALPDSAVLVTFRCVGNEGSLSVITPSAARVLSALERAGIFQRLQPTGSIARVSAVDGSLERIGIHFDRLRAAVPDATTGRRTEP